MRYLLSRSLFLIAFLFCLGVQPALAFDINIYGGYSPWSYGSFGFSYGSWLGLGYGGYGGTYFYGFPRVFSFSSYPGEFIYAPYAVSYPRSYIPMIERQVEDKRLRYYGLKDTTKQQVKKDEKEFSDFEKTLPEIRSTPSITGTTTPTAETDSQPTTQPPH